MPTPADHFHTCNERTACRNEVYIVLGGCWQPHSVLYQARPLFLGTLGEVLHTSVSFLTLGAIHPPACPPLVPFQPGLPTFCQRETQFCPTCFFGSPFQTICTNSDTMGGEYHLLYLSVRSHLLMGSPNHSESLAPCAPCNDTSSFLGWPSIFMLPYLGSPRGTQAQVLSEISALQALHFL